MQIYYISAFYNGLYCEYFYYIKLLLAECALIQRIKLGRFVVYVTFHLPRFGQDSGGEKLLSEVPVIDLDAEHSLQKILQLTDGELLRKQLECHLRPEDFLLQHGQRI